MTAYRIWYDTKYYIHKDSNESHVYYTTNIKKAASFGKFHQLINFLDKIGLRDSINKQYDPIHY